MKEQADQFGAGDINNSFSNNNVLQQQQHVHHLQHHNSKDVNHSSDTEDCDLELGSGRLVIDLEAESSTTSSSTTATTTTINSIEDGKSLKSEDKQQLLSNNSKKSCNNNNGGFSKKSNNGNNNNIMKMSHSFSEVSNNSSSNRGRVSYSISSVPGNNGNGGTGYSTSPQVSYSTVSMTAQEQAANPAQQNKCIKMKIKRNTVAQGSHTPLSATSHLSATLHQPHSQNSPPPPPSSSSSSSASLNSSLAPTTASVMPSSVSPPTLATSNGYQAKTAIMENSVFTYKIQRSSTNNCMTSVNSVTCKNVPLGSLPLSTSSTTEGTRGLNQHHHHHQGGTSYLSEGCQTTPYPSSGGMPTRSAKQPNNKRSKQSHNHSNTTGMYTANTNNNNKTQNFPATSTQQQHDQITTQSSSPYQSNNNSKQSSLTNTPYSGMPHHPPFGYDPSAPKYPSRGSHKSSSAALLNGRDKAVTTPGDPYDFNCTGEDVGGVILKKLKNEKCERACSPITALRRDVEVEACHVGVITDPDCLGPCEPGTSVTLEGIVWNETENGLLVVNVTWRGKTYVGTLMDATRHHWAPPRFTGESPTSDLDGRAQKGRGKRGRNNPVAPPPPVRPDNGSDRKLRSNRNNGNSSKQLQTAPSPVRSNGGMGGDFGLKKNRSDQSNDSMNSSYSNNICRKTSTRSESRMSYSESSTNDDCATSCNSTYSSSTSIMIECPEENCNKKYRNSVGLKYHQTRCHQSKTVTPTTSTAPTSSGSATTAETPILVEGKSQSLKESKQEAQERNSTSSEDGDTSSSSSSSSSHSSVAQKHKSTMRSGQLESSKQTSMDNAKVPPRQEDPAVTTGVPLANSFPVTPLMSSAQIVNNSTTTASSFVGCTSSDKTSTSTSTESGAVVTLNGSMSETNKNGVENEATPEITTKTPMNNNNVNSINNNSNINNNNNNIVINNNINNNNAPCNTSTNELKLHSISTMTHQTTETCPSERTGKRKKRERHLAIDRNNDTNSNAAALDGCYAPSAKNPKLENDGKENSADKLSAEQQVGSFSSVSSAMASSAPVSTMPVSSMTGNLYAGTIDRPIYISTSTDDCLTSFNPSPSIVPSSTSTSTVIRSTSGLSSTSIYDGVRDSPRETSSATSATSENGIIYSTLSVGSNHLETPKQSTDKRHSPLTMGEYPCHSSGVVPMDVNNSEFTHNKRLRLSPADDNNKNNAISQQHQKHTPSDLNMIPQDAPSPAYSDISDANENAPMLEKEANQTSMSTEDEVSVLRCLSSEGPSTPHGGPKQQDSFVCSPFYGLMPQLTPVVSSPVVVNREFANKFSLVGSNPSGQYGSEDAPSADKISPSTLESQKNENVKFGDSSSTSSSSSSKKHDFCQSSQRTSSGQHMSDSLRKTPSSSIMSGEVNPNQVHLLSVPPMSALGFPQTLFSGAFNFGDREVRAHWERFMEMQQKQYHDVELHKQDQEAKYRAENSSLKPLVDERYKHAPILPAPPSLISDYSKFKPKEDYPTALNPSLWDGSKSQSRDIQDLRGAPTPDHHGSSKTSEKFDRRYLPPPPPHILEQPFQHSHQSSKAGAGDGGKPSAVVAPQTREKIGNVGQLPKGSYDAGNRENRSSQQHPKYSSSANNSSYSGSYSFKTSRDGRQQLKEDNSSAPHKKEENVMKSSSSSISSSKTKLRSGSSDAASSQQPTGLQLPPSPSPMPAPYPPPPSFYPPFLTPGAPYMPSPFDPAFLSTMNPIAAMLQQPPYGIHPSQILHPAAAAPGSLNMNTPDPKSQAPGHQHHRTCLDFDSGSAHHKIHELKEVAKGETSSGNPGSSLENRPLSSGGMQHSSVIQSGGSSSAGRDVVKDKDTSSEPALQRHLHTHHHMHVIGPYAYMNSESAMLASQPNNSSGVSPQLPRPSYLGK